MRNKLSKIPVINRDITWKEANGEVVLFRKNKGLFNRFLIILINKPRTSYIHLDKIGSFIWKKLDGNNSVSEIGLALEKEFGSSVFPLYERLIKFLGILKENKIITFK